jgi:phosphohistidine phosphatase SixA
VKTYPRKRLILIRHAHRDLSDRDLDNGLSDKGHAQVKKLLKLADDELPKKPRATFMSSPKARCIQTIEPLAEAHGAELEICGWLDEGDHLDSRVKEFTDWWRSSRAPELTVICSHGDWIPLCLKVLTGVEQAIEKGGWAEVSLSLWDGP